MVGGCGMVGWLILRYWILARTHRDLKVWQLSMDLVENIYAYTSGFPDTEKFGLVNQMRRAAVSVPSNIAEGAARRSKKEFLRYLHISRGSLAELHTQMQLSERLKMGKDSNRCQILHKRVVQLLGGLIRQVDQRKS